MSRTRERVGDEEDFSAHGNTQLTTFAARCCRHTPTMRVTFWNNLATHGRFVRGLEQRRGTIRALFVPFGTTSGLKNRDFRPHFGKSYVGDIRGSYACTARPRPSSMAAIRWPAQLSLVRWAGHDCGHAQSETRIPAHRASRCSYHAC